MALRLPVHIPLIITFRVAVTLLGVWWVPVASPAHAAVFAALDTSSYDRYSNGGFNPNFIIDQNALNLSGLAGNPSTGANRAVLITPRHYISAVHAPTSAPTFRGIDGVFRSYSASTSTDLVTTLADNTTATSDIRLYTLDAPIPEAHGVAPMPILGGDPANLIGHEFYVAGQNNQVGRNIINRIVAVNFNNNNLGLSYAIEYSFDTATNGGTGGLGDDEAGLYFGDSGHAAFIRIGDQFALIGTHFGIDISDGQNPLDKDLYNSYSTLLTPYLDQVSAVTSQTGYSFSTLAVTAVPEPNVLVIMGSLSLLVAARGRMRAAKFNAREKVR